jgi:hypothetical protein
MAPKSMATDKIEGRFMGTIARHNDRGAGSEPIKELKDLDIHVLWSLLMKKKREAFLRVL